MQFLKLILSILSFLFIVNVGAQNNKFLEQNIFFRFDQTQINSKHQEKIKLILASLGNSQVHQIFLRTYKDSTLGEKSDEVGGMRLKSLQSYLEKLGFTDKLISTSYIAEYPLISCKEQVEAGDIFQPVNILLSYSQFSSSKNEIAKKNIKDIKELEAYYINSRVCRPEDLKKEIQPSTTKSEIIDCNRDTVLEFCSGALASINYCDFEKIKLYWKTEEFIDPMGQEIPNLDKKDDQFMQILAIYDFDYPRDMTLNHPVYVRVPLDRCLEFYDLNLYKYDHTETTLITNKYDKVSHSIVFELTGSGSYYLAYMPQNKDFKAVMFDFSGDEKLLEFHIDMDCIGIQVRPLIKSNKVLVNLPYPYYEPKISFKVMKKNGDLRTEKRIPLSELKGKKEIDKVRVGTNIYFDKTIDLSIYSNYKLE
jgi:hypothetical protein